MLIAKNYSNLVSVCQGQRGFEVLKNKDECEIQRALVTLGNIYLENAPRVKDEDKSGCIQEAEKHYQKALESIPVTVSSHEKIEMTLDCHYNLAQLASLAGKSQLIDNIFLRFSITYVQGPGNDFYVGGGPNNKKMKFCPF